jgi:hypothetical protein
MERPPKDEGRAPVPPRQEHPANAEQLARSTNRNSHFIASHWRVYAQEEFADLGLIDDAESVGS